MNYSMVRYLLCFVMRIEGLFMVPSLLLAVYEKDSIAARSFAICILILCLLSFLGAKKPESKEFFAKEGFVAVGLVWIVLSLFGALPFFMSGHADFIDSIFESVSGFTTTGASIFARPEALPKSIQFWRSFTHFAGGIGVLVFLLALLPMSNSSGGNTMHLLRAESTGPQVSKIMPKMRDTAKLLCTIYIALTIMLFLFLILGGMPVFESITNALSIAGTGGFSINSTSAAGYSNYIKIIMGIFMLLFGVNFTIYYFLFTRKLSKIFKNEELKVFLVVCLLAVVLITSNVVITLDMPLKDTLLSAFFHMSSVVSTTGLLISDFDYWPMFSRLILLLLMFTGSCAGSTGGGLKITRIIILFKYAKNSLMKAIRPRQVSKIQLNGVAIEAQTISDVTGYIMIYTFVFITSLLLISLEGFSFDTTLSSVATTLNNVGIGFDRIGPTGEGFVGFSDLSKIVLCLNMLIGRLELYPMLLLFTTAAWKKGR